MKQMKRILLLAIITTLTYQNSFSQKMNCKLTINVKNIKEMKGSLKYALYNSREKFLKDAYIFGGAEIQNSTVTITVDSIVGGNYAVSVFHDKNNNDELDTNFIGIPKEPYAFSNNAKGMFGPPNFEQCRFLLENSSEITIEL